MRDRIIMAVVFLSSEGLSSFAEATDSDDTTCVVGVVFTDNRYQIDFDICRFRPHSPASSRALSIDYTTWLRHLQQNKTKATDLKPKINSSPVPCTNRAVHASPNPGALPVYTSHPRSKHPQAPAHPRRRHDNRTPTSDPLSPADPPRRPPQTCRGIPPPRINSKA